MLTEPTESWATADDGVPLWTVRSGAGPRTVLVCHGGPGGWDLMEPVAEMLDDIATVVRWDQRGCGRSHGDGPYTYARFLNDLDAVREHWHVNSCVVGGHSAGASLALFYALENPERTDAVVYLSGTGLRWDSAVYRAEREARMGPYLNRWRELRGKSAPTTDEQKEIGMLSFAADFGDVAEWREPAARWWDERFEPNVACNQALAAEVPERSAWSEARLASIRCPVLVAHGEMDPRPAPRHIADGIAGARFELLAGVGHIPWAQRPELLRALLREFVTNV